MPIATEADDLESAVRRALMTTHATAVCPFHPELTVRVGDDAAETHAFYRARNLVKCDSAGRDHDLLVKEFSHQLDGAADRVCPHCQGELLA